MHSLEAEVGQLFVAGFAGTEIDPELVRLARAERLTGAILFRRNIGSLESARALTDALHAARDRDPLLVAVDQEGGRVQRLRTPFPELPPMRAFGRAGRPKLAAEAGEIVGAALRVMGFDQCYAPVLDVDSNPANPVIGDRAFSDDPEVVSALGVAFAKGLGTADIAACGKHFPGHGDTHLDSHIDLPTLPHDLERLRSVELRPFEAAARADLPSLMTAHVVFEALDPGTPATLSKRVITELLRGELGYQGVVVSDDLEMKAIADHYGVEEAAVLAIEAGCDQVLICHHLDLVDRAFDAVLEAVRDGRLPEARVREAAGRVRKMKQACVRIEPAPEDLEVHLTSERHRALLAALAADETVGLDPTERDEIA